MGGSMDYLDTVRPAPSIMTWQAARLLLQAPRSGWIRDIPFAARKCMVAPSSRRSGLVGYRSTQLKCGRMDTPRNLQAGAFAGTAEAYFRYRPPYPKALLASLVTQAHLPGSAVLLDLACGPGRVTLDLAASF